MKKPLKPSSLKRLLCIALAVVMMAGFVPMEAKAYEFKYQYHYTTLKQNVYAAPKPRVGVNGTIHTYYFKINVPADGYIKVQGKKRLDGVCIYKTLKKEFRYEDTLSEYGGGGKISYHALRKGTYYLYVESDSKIKWNFVNPKSYDQQKNYCRAKATTLAKGKKKTIFFNFKYDFPRWYKITLTKKQRITLSCSFLDEGDFHYEIVDSRGLDVDDTYNSFYYGNYYGGKKPKEKTGVLPKGTYYLFIERDWEADNESRICQISWN